MKEIAWPGQFWLLFEFFCKHVQTRDPNKVKRMAEFVVGEEGTFILKCILRSVWMMLD